MSGKQIGIIGAGRLGTAVAKLALTAGYHVDITNSGDTKILDLTLQVLLPEATAKSVNVLIDTNKLILLAIPFGQYKNFPREVFKGKVVIDATNHWEPTEGVIEAYAASNLTSSEFLQNYFSEAKFVKTLNHIAYSELWTDSSFNSKNNRRAVALASDDDDARKAGIQFVEDIGFNVVDFGELKNGKYFQPDTTLFNARLHKEQLEKEFKKTIA